MLKYEPMYSNLREVSKRFHFPAGNYCIIPTTFRMGEEGEFLIRTFVEKYWGSSDQGDKQSFREGGCVGGRGKPESIAAAAPVAAPPSVAPPAAAAPAVIAKEFDDINSINIPLDDEEENGGDANTGKTRERKRFVSQFNSISNFCISIYLGTN